MTEPNETKVDPPSTPSTPTFRDLKTLEVEIDKIHVVEGHSP
jgi:hypothetical protein